MSKKFLLILTEYKFLKVIIFAIIFIPSIIIIYLSGIFDKKWYKNQYNSRFPFLFKYIPVFHYLLYGRRKGYTPSMYFIPDFFDEKRGRNSLIDPLVKYVINKRMWLRPTSLVFNPGLIDVKKSIFLPPLSDYLKKEKTKDIKELEARVEDFIIKRNNHLKNVKSIDPTHSFDYDKEKEYIDKYKKYKKNKNAPLISIIMPVWNRESMVISAIESIQKQTYSNWELIITDDGSTDGTVRKIKKELKKDRRIKLYESKHVGVCRARNNSINKSNGEWVAFLDSDNQWNPDYLSTMLATLTEKKKTAGYSAIKMFVDGKYCFRTTKHNPKLLEIGNYIDLNALVIKKSVLDDIGYFDKTLRRMVDYDLICRVSDYTDILYVPIIGVNYINHSDIARISTTESVYWGGVVKSRNFIPWSSLVDKKREEGVSIVIPVYGNTTKILRCIDNILQKTNYDKFEIILIDNGRTSSTSTLLSIMAINNDRVTYKICPGANDVPLKCNYSLLYLKYDKIIVIKPSVVVNEDWLSPILDQPYNNTIISPLRLDDSLFIQSAGYYFHKNKLVSYMQGHRIEDIQKIKRSLGVDAVESGCFLINTKDFIQLKGLNSLYGDGFESIDFCFRAKKIGIKSIVCPESSILNEDYKRGWCTEAQNQLEKDWSGQKENGNALWRRVGYKVIEYIKKDPYINSEGILVPKLRRINVQKKSFRWSIKISAPSNEKRFAWGDLYFANGLADALRNQGQEVTVDYHDGHLHGKSYLDDILLDLRGLDDVRPQKNKINIMWVISHPDKINKKTLDGFDIVFAAGSRWCAEKSREFDREIIYLPQCTDASVFKPQDEKDKNFLNKTIFIGNSRLVYRKVVKDAISAKINVNIYGGNWEGIVEDKYIRADFIPNNQLPCVYSSARYVLNDHWDDMRRWGFISNRIFDVVASGGCVITDEIEGLYDIFDDRQVITYSDPKDLKNKINLKNNLSKKYILDNAMYIKKEHSFDARAKKIINAVIDINNKMNTT